MPRTLNVPDSLYELIPENIDDANLEDYLLASLEVGLRAMNQANINADTTIVSDTFRRISDSLSGRLIGEHSELSQSVNNLFSQSDCSEGNGPTHLLQWLGSWNCSRLARRYTEAVTN